MHRRKRVQAVLVCWDIKECQRTQKSVTLFGAESTEKPNSLREGGITAAENGSSVVLYGQIDGRNIFLTADAGLKALGVAVSYGNAIGLQFGTALNVFRVPHHGSRSNISPTLLNRIVGNVSGLNEKFHWLRHLGGA
ncbi:hypothetical protein J6524_09805 [Bradyrhizobium sp. WSM 1738]|uniref:hypothetical protein n=1 Tax=Bradyrhizobium hereditatis TaxID=2821405 RepID=UPI001CE375BE|nr:hypothetical protein [Bradyrhizobium hereditatis]MCA6115194.1 hypothetical protein [Bradyrhizobium hereditatis]